MKREFMTDINKIKFEVYREVARMAFDGKLKECADEIPYNIIPGNTPHYRCCVYKEREITVSYTHLTLPTILLV